MIKQKVDNTLVFNDRKLEGVLSVRDILRVAMTGNQRISNPGKAGRGAQSRGAVVDRTPVMQMPVGSFIATGPLLTVTKENTLMDAIALMHRRNIRDIIVQEHDKVFGMVTTKDLLNSLIKLNL